MKKIPRGWFWLIFILIIGLLYGLFHNLYVTEEFNPLSLNLLDRGQNVELGKLPAVVKREKRNMNGVNYEALWVGEGRTDIPFHLERPQTLKLKIKGYFPSSEVTARVLVLYVNDLSFSTLKPLWRGDEEVFRLKVDKRFLRAGGNTVGLGVAGKGGLPAGVSYIKVRNFVGRSNNFPRGFVIFDENYVMLGPDPFDRPLDYLLFPLSLTLLWLVSANLMTDRGRRTLAHTLKRSLYANIPGALLVAGAFVFSISTPYTVVTSTGTFLALVYLPCGLIIVYHLLFKNYRQIIRRLISDRGNDEAPVDIPPLRHRVERAVSPFLYIAGKAGTVAVSGFVIFLVAAGILMIMKRQVLAERCADIAYFMLVFGVVMRLFDIRRTEDG